ncbi:DUF4232 domain-containing protein [Leifsonia sp. C5G2]|uniref:DUF4232 domain-containing protein n=1 Tax=Leifsonia sp. C5G2 TaxID=2735269 RepID=UPI001584FF78|nr:DUF4232 domain-containing protein [Leifsonia sp. C5G2]NUU07123.1 DUF4232 domain-containing protein [Leifsonia sp. C5G2]
MTGKLTFRAAGAAAVALAVAVVVAACATTNSGQDTGTPTASSSSTATTSPRPTATASSTAVPIEGQCDTGKLTGSIGRGGGGAAGSVEVSLVLTNTGSTECSLQGWPGVSFVGDGNGTQLGAAASFDRSKPHPTVVLQPGGTATAPLKITQALNYDEAECKPKAADGFRVYPPGSTESLFVKDAGVTACTSDTISLLTVGGLVAG